MRKALTICCSFLLGGALLADEVDKRTVVTLGQPVIVAGVPTVTLEPGKYVFKLLNSESDRHIVQIFNEREDHLFTTILAIANYRLIPADKSQFRFYETPAGNPVALHAWFFPGDNWGQEFVYPKGLAAKIARESGERVLATEAESESGLLALPLFGVNKEGIAEPIEEALLEPVPEPAPEAPAVNLAEVAPIATTFAPEEVPLPATGGPLYTFAVAGVFLVIAGIGLHGAAKLRPF